MKSPKQPEDWEIEFDKKFMNATLRSDYYDDIKSFISHLLEEARKEERSRILKEVGDKVIGKDVEIFPKDKNILHTGIKKDLINRFRRDQRKAFLELEEK